MNQNQNMKFTSRKRKEFHNPHSSPHVWQPLEVFQVATWVLRTWRQCCNTWTTTTRAVWVCRSCRRAWTARSAQWRKPRPNWSRRSRARQPMPMTPGPGIFMNFWRLFFHIFFFLSGLWVSKLNDCIEDFEEDCLMMPWSFVMVEASGSTIHQNWSEEL